MNEVIREWIDKAEGDYDVAQLALRAAKPHHDAVCFHAQQCVEKLMKALLIHHGIQPPRIHNLVALDEVLVQLNPGWVCPAAELRFLNKGAGALRYPGARAERDDAVHAMTICTRLRETLLNLLAGEKQP